MPTSSSRADGVNSAMRRSTRRSSSPTSTCASAVSSGSARTQRFEAFTFAFERTEHGWFQMHAYRFSEDLSTFIVETREETWRAPASTGRHGAVDRVLREAVRASISTATGCMSNAAPPARLGLAQLPPRAAASAGITRNVVLIGDAAHTAHFSIGSGTKLAMEDAIALARTLRAAATCTRRSRAYQAERALEALRLQNAARNRMEWFENVARYTQLDAGAVRLQPADGQPAHRPREPAAARRRIRRRRRGWLARAARRHGRSRGRRCSRRSGCAALTLDEPRRRVADGAVLGGGRHAERLPPGALGSRAHGGAGLVVTEMTCVVAGRAHHARLHRALERGAARRLAAHRRFRARAHAGKDLPAARSRRAARARRSSAGRRPTSRCRAATGR